MEQREEVTFDMGQPVGPTNQNVSNLTSFLGTIGRNKRFRKFILPASTEKWVIQSIREAWKRFKGRIKHRHFLPYDNVEEMVLNRPIQVLPSEVIKLILYWSHPLIQSISEKNKEHSHHKKFPHRMGPINFARREAKGTNEEPKRFEMFIATRTNRKRKELDEATQHVIV
ncbi:hypothetical protein PIB30_085026 [Stylosanthes scabra]|uniref:Uncharacterized protein n=1 Tax=Stylosanthes scabra TaxID=79078 RepID=A0ABU6TV03_9FABA|nr:hypothetical protein [Stylosanthes scabra]